ncbi:MAG: hypothetical protein HZB26_26375 [Candidatus Hydrogenedentes bacterium]|nr:hypothetical protein [Candidatus Hydrogenedentota bacterium]
MPKLESFTVRLRTGQRAPSAPPTYVINGFLVEFDKTSGAAKPGEVYEATGEPGSFPHSLLLCGPKEGAWDIDEVSVTYHCHGEDAYTIRLGAVTLDDASDLNIWYERPAPVFDV